jgi:hypothetical protein
MYGQSPDWYPEKEPDIFKPLPDFNAELTTLTRVYNLEQEVNRLKVDLEELRKSLAVVNTKIEAAPEVVANAVVLAFDKTRTKKPAKKPAKKTKR